jgi:hypothetical protein
MKTREHLQSVAGNATWVNEFKPTDYEHKQFFDTLLKKLFMLNVCCAVVGTFPANAAAALFGQYSNTGHRSDQLSHRGSNFIKKRGASYLFLVSIV